MKKHIKFLILTIITFFMVFNTFNANATPNLQRKIVYLTFDDGPSPNNTENIISILNQNNVKATFCVVGSNALKYKQTIKDLDNFNMGIIPHCNNHHYSQLYSSTEYYINDLKECTNIINNITGKNRQYKFIRMPGGSDNHVCSSDVLYNIKTELKNEGINYIDWSVDSGDACSKLVTTENIEKNINKQAGMHKIEVVLMHDLENKTTTSKALQDIIDKYKTLGYEFKTFDEIEDWEIQYLIDRHVLNK
ncbi:polysaccharide deacetylase family protein [Clostridium uliginosum]|uniref:Peptidoglycan/xylan/chitin deacetylase, PgdA/CDA1 family n=1 Tax=Clostridium uliginosum TaxID=119641 RepID=A0A1I1KA86_9CLOT|nr:polysaccharide deacetylase family protein [Clostridium uliginosum]SFC57824.1 Peptidoglycan/xylan/chitin deacetylase, PgdA/CDA1 family [Clostridium uliginosum]